MKIKRIRDTLFYKLSRQIYDFGIFKTIKPFGDNHKIEIHKANQEQVLLKAVFFH